ncbi:tetratricopeptide repeat protein, partial [Streptomyces sp. SID5770]|uniref:tetratricopeptide repeat protein n=1 Tax=Streptomyces sp. SID5770 TaxID=2690308 RepID=UPI00136F66EE
DIAATLHNLAAIAHRRGDLQTAHDHYTRALAIKDKVLGPGHPECAITLINLGALHRSRHCPEQAHAF